MRKMTLEAGYDVDDSEEEEEPVLISTKTKRTSIPVGNPLHTKNGTTGIEGGESKGAPKEKRKSMLPWKKAGKEDITTDRMVAGTAGESKTVERLTSPGVQANPLHAAASGGRSGTGM